MWLWWVLAAYNALVLAVYGIDKWKAGRQAWRTPERTLLWLAAAGGGAGAFLGMRLFRHKTRKPAFRFGVPALLALQLAVLIYAGQQGWFNFGL